MKKILFILLTGAAVLSSSLKADIDFQDVGPTDIVGVRESDARGPFKIEFTFDAVGRGKMKDSDHRIQFATAEIELSAVFYHDASIDEGASIGLSYERSRIDWNRNPFYRQKDFDVASLNVAFSSKRLCDWLWKGQLTANFDNLKHWNFNEYMNYDMLLWGRYDYRNVGINLGVLALTGMKIDRVYPIIGVDWKYGEKWIINLVFPMNVSVVYNITQHWAATVAARLFYERHRLAHDEVLKKGLIVYTTTGAEFGVNYTPNAKLFANLHLGYDAGGRFKRANRHYNNKHHYKIEGAPYAGCQLDYAF
ncbi:MAG: hypothetical protein H0X29_05270 [Parachlamydiaceae bacterium]|nr:hypothetical protein [Parachlamydiaceae bacterium]